MIEAGPAARTFTFAQPYEEVDAHYQERGWTDGLPIVPPTEARVEEFLRWTDRGPRDIVAILPPRQGEATVEKLAVNAVMAGCRPDYFPVIVTAIEALADPLFNLDSVQATTHPVAPLLVVNGPVAVEIGINPGYNAFGQGFRANATIGRAVRLVLMNIGGGLPGTGDRSTQGSPAKFAYCVAENESQNPWEPLHVEAGLPRVVSTVTAFGAEGPHNIQDHYSNTGIGVLRTIAGAMGQAGSNNLLGAGWPLLSLGPDHAATIARDGYTKAQVKEFLFEEARFPLAKLGAEYREHLIERRGMADAPDTMVPIVKSPEDISIVVVGGAGKHSSWQPTFGNGTHYTRRVIARRDGTPLARVADLRRYAHMRFGTFYFFQAAPGLTHEEVVHRELEQMKWTEELGFDQIWLTEHHFIDYGLAVDPATLACAAASRTERVRIGLAAAILPFHHPLRLAEQLALVDVISRGRLDVGVGRGNRPAEFTGYHIPQQENRERFDEAVDIMLRAWTEERFSHEGRFFTVKNARVIPKPLQRPYPKIYQVCGSDEGIESTASRGWPMLNSVLTGPVDQLLKRRDSYLMALKRHGRSDDETARLMKDWGVSRQIYVAPTDAQALAEAKDYEMWYQDSLRRFQIPERIEDAHPSLQPGFRAAAERFAKVTWEGLVAETLAFGSPDTVARHIETMRDMGVGQVLCWMNFGGLPQDKIRRSMELFAREVMPHFRK